MPSAARFIWPVRSSRPSPSFPVTPSSVNPISAKPMAPCRSRAAIPGAHCTLPARNSIRPVGMPAPPARRTVRPATPVAALRTGGGAAHRQGPRPPPRHRPVSASMRPSRRGTAPRPTARRPLTAAPATRPVRSVNFSALPSIGELAAQVDRDRRRRAARQLGIGGAKRHVERAVAADFPGAGGARADVAGGELSIDPERALGRAVGHDGEPGRAAIHVDELVEPGERRDDAAVIGVEPAIHVQHRRARIGKRPAAAGVEIGVDPGDLAGQLELCHARRGALAAARHRASP